MMNIFEKEFPLLLQKNEIQQDKCIISKSYNTIKLMYIVFL